MANASNHDRTCIDVLYGKRVTEKVRSPPKLGTKALCIYVSFDNIKTQSPVIPNSNHVQQTTSTIVYQLYTLMRRLFPRLLPSLIRLRLRLRLPSLLPLPLPLPIPIPSPIASPRSLHLPPPRPLHLPSPRPLHLLLPPTPTPPLPPL
jgi:hypothetical protein